MHRFLFRMMPLFWSEAYDDILPGDIMVHDGGTLYFFATPYFPGQTGSYLLDLHVSRTPLTATHEILSAENISVSPNPASDVIHIDLGKTDQQFKQVNLVNPFGQILASEVVDSRENITLPVSEVAAGMYFIVFESPKGTLSKKIMISR